MCQVRVNSTILGKTGTEGLTVNITRFVTGAQRTEPRHIETAFEVCLETAKLAIQEFAESELEQMR